MAISYVGTGVFQASTAGVTVPLPAGWQSGDLLILIVNTANQPIPTPTGWTQVTYVSPTGIGTAGSAGATCLQIFYKRAGTVENPCTVPDAGNYVTAVMCAVRNAQEIYSMEKQSSTDTNEIRTMNSYAPVDGCMNMSIIGFDADKTATAYAGFPYWVIYPSRTGTGTEYDLGPPVKCQISQVSNVGVGGGIEIETSVLPYMGSTGQLLIGLPIYQAAVQVTLIITPIPPSGNPPIITVLSTDRTVVSDEQGMNICTVEFKSDVALTEWEARADGNGVGQGDLVGFGGSLGADVAMNFGVVYNELPRGDKDYRINIYGKSVTEMWSIYGS